MKKTVALFLCIFLLVSISGCQYFYVDRGQELYSETVHTLFDALDRKNVDAIYSLFSVSVQKDCPDLKEKIEKLISIYSGPTEKIGDISSLAEEGVSEYGNVCKNAYTYVPVFSDGAYYWIYLDFMYENTFDEDETGITQIDFWTADAYYDFWISGKQPKDNKGLNIFDEHTQAYDIISIDNLPYDYHPTEILDVEEVEAFLKTTGSMNAFVEEFGTAAAKDEFGAVYSLPEQDGEDRYLYICCQGDQIVYVDILNNFGYVDRVLKEKK